MRRSEKQKSGWLVGAFGSRATQLFHVSSHLFAGHSHSLSSAKRELTCKKMSKKFARIITTPRRNKSRENKKQQRYFWELLGRCKEDGLGKRFLKRYKFVFIHKPNFSVEISIAI